MTITTTTSMPASTSGGTAVRTRRPVSQVSIAAGAATLAVIEAYGAIAHAAGRPLRAAALGAPRAPSGVPALRVFFSRRAARPARAFLATTLPLLTLSLTGPLTAHATAATKVTLACGHLIAAAIIIPVVTRRLAVARRAR